MNEQVLMYCLCKVVLYKTEDNHQRESGEMNNTTNTGEYVNSSPTNYATVNLPDTPEHLYTSLNTSKIQLLTHSILIKFSED